MRTRVAFVNRAPRSGFMDVDRRCLERNFEIEELYYPGRPTPTFAAAAVLAAKRCDVLYAFFGSEHALLPALAFKAARKPFVLVPGGYDYAYVPERRYGLAARGRGWLPKLLGRLCDVALPVSGQVRDEFLGLVPSASDRTIVAPLAVDANEWCSPEVARVPNRVITVAYVDEEAWSRKGIDVFIAAAEADPEREYVLAGRVHPEIEAVVRRQAPDNLSVTGMWRQDDLCRLLWSSSVYAQLSWHEAFGVSMVEAMLCGCRPVITPLPALREVAGDWAVVVEGNDVVRAIARASEEAFDRVAMQKETAARFSIERREQILAEVVQSVLR